ncbi:uncharacterized protein LOC124545655 [Schistocerca americana]|uniref:uncharacterized protein LOC124545655 n=1 Tax=Schistocerca americana TaxID=7009 RepID=UPI001F502C61|nr:uncharacterized protein LOC124545655 [Schistocerca americana]
MPQRCRVLRLLTALCNLACEAKGPSSGKLWPGHTYRPEDVSWATSATADGDGDGDGDGGSRFVGSASGDCGGEGASPIASSWEEVAPAGGCKGRAPFAAQMAVPTAPPPPPPQAGTAPPAFRPPRAISSSECRLAASGGRAMETALPPRRPALQHNEAPGRRRDNVCAGEPPRVI